jgi:hypothetical protein
MHSIIGAVGKAMLRARIQRLKWPVPISVFVTHFLHHVLAFFVWSSPILHVAVPMAAAGRGRRPSAK